MNSEQPALTELEYAGFCLRLAACIIDSILVCIMTMPMLLSVYRKGYWSSPHWIAGPADFLISWVLPTVLTVVCWRLWQATPGKMAIAARVVDARTGGNPTLNQLVIRALGYFLSTLVFGLGFVWVAFDLRKQRWHDKLANTVVIRPRARGALPVSVQGR